jgi:hypothetical protein
MGFGKSAIRQSQQVKYNGMETLEPGREYRWRVKAWDTRNNSSEWSEMDRFRMAPSDTELKPNGSERLTKKRPISRKEESITHWLPHRSTEK